MNLEQTEARLRTAFAATAEIRFPIEETHGVAPTRNVGTLGIQRWLAPALGAAVAVVIAAITVPLIEANNAPISSQATRPAHQAHAQCVAPFLRTNNDHTPPSPGHPTTLGTVEAGSRVIVYGKYYYAGTCNDVVLAGQSPRPLQLAKSVTLFLKTSGARSRAITTAKPTGHDASFTAAFTIPNDVPPVPAAISDGRGHIVTLTIEQ